MRVYLSINLETSNQANCSPSYLLVFWHLISEICILTTPLRKYFLQLQRIESIIDLQIPQDTLSKGLNSEIDYIIHISFFDPNLSFSLLITFNGHKNKDSVKKNESSCQKGKTYVYMHISYKHLISRPLTSSYKD